MNVHARGARKRPTSTIARLAAAAVIAISMVTTASAQKNFSSPEAAMDAFGQAVMQQREDALQAMFGKDFRELIPPVDAPVREMFIAKWEQSHAIEPVDASHAHIAVGGNGWTFPIPLVKTDQGWRFDTRAGIEEMRVRRIGRNELAVIQTMLAVYDAQREYAQTHHDGERELVYAAKLVSTPGKHDGLYWPTGPNEPPSPLGEDFVHAVSKNPQNAGYHGYHFKLLQSQGQHAPGGAYGYIVRGKLFGGFAVMAWPVKYGDTGIKSFMVSHAGQVYERDLGPNSAARAEATKSFDPGAGWNKVPVSDSD